MSACLFMYSAKQLKEMRSWSQKQLWEEIKALFRFLDQPYDENSKFECDRWSGMYHNLQCVFIQNIYGPGDTYLNETKGKYTYRERLAFAEREGMFGTKFMEELIEKIEELEKKNG